jgi:histidinol-phosphate aminotransferase
VIVGNGSNEMLLVLLLSLLDTAPCVIICEPTFTVYSLLVGGLGGKLTRVALAEDLSYDTEALITASRNNPDAVMLLASPNNPTGSSLAEADLRSILSTHRGFCIVDQAYVEFGGYDATALLETYPNLIVTRTFSKAFAGAGLRLGYMIGAAEVIAEFNKIKLPYNINFFSERVAEVCIENRALIYERIETIVAHRETLYRNLCALPFVTVYPGDANFILVRMRAGRPCIDFLAHRGILVRDVSSYPMLQECIRITVGTKQENEMLIDALKDFFSTAAHENT